MLQPWPIAKAYSQEARSAPSSSRSWSTSCTACLRSWSRAARRRRLAPVLNAGAAHSATSARTRSFVHAVDRSIACRLARADQVFPEPGDNWGTEPSAPNDRRSDRGPGWDAAARLRPLCLIGPLRRSPTIGSSRSATSVHQLSAEPDDCFSSGAGVGSAPVETPACQEEQRCLRPFAVSVAARIRPLRQRCRPNVGVASRAL
jgi:hypothetical protein